MGLPDSIGGIQPFVELRQGVLTNVYKGYQASLDRYVLLKILNKKYARDASFVERFEEEARLMAKVQAPNVVNVHSFGKENNTIYLAAEYIEGYNLAQIIDIRPIPFALAAFVLLEASKGLHAAYKKGILHRDIKPSNILVSHEGHVKLTDFGLASIISPKATDSSEIRGTIAYLAPELVLSEQPGHASDLFSLGATFYEMLTGLPAFAGEEPSIIFDAVLHFDPLLSLKANANIPPDIIDICERLLAKEPVNRFEDVVDLIAEIETFQSNHYDNIGASEMRTYLVAPEAYNLKRSTKKAIYGTNGFDLTKEAGVAILSSKTQVTPSNRFLGAVALVVFLVLSYTIWIQITENVSNSEASLTELIGTELLIEDSLKSVERLPPVSSTEVLQVSSAGGVSDDESTLQDSLEDVHLNAIPESKAPDSVLIYELEAPGTLSFACIPWCTIYLDADSVGSFPPTASISVSPGAHSVRLVNPKFPEYSTQVHVVSGQDEEVKVSLWNLVGKLEITVLPWAEVYVDGDYKGDTPFEKPLIIRPGSRELSLKHPMLGTWDTTLSVSEGELLKRSYNLKELIDQ